LQSALQVLGGQYYDIVLYDCPHSFCPLTLNALTASSWVLVPVTCDFFSFQSLQAYLNLLSVVHRNSNPELQYRILITLYDRRTRISQLMLDQYRKKFNSVLFETVIPLDTRLRESSLFGRPITQYASRTRSAQEYRSLAKELLTCLKVTI
jgi:chromosome partitioning protein